MQANQKSIVVSAKIPHKISLLMRVLLSKSEKGSPVTGNRKIFWFYIYNYKKGRLF